MLRILGFSAISPNDSYLSLIFGKIEVTEVKGGRIVKKLDFESEKNQNKWKKMKYPTLI